MKETLSSPPHIFAMQEGVREASQRRPIPPGTFSVAAIRIAVAQICTSVGFKCAQASALETLVDVAGKYLTAVGNSAAKSANSAGRSQANLLDVAGAIDDLHSGVGFPGASIATRPLYPSFLLMNIMNFVNWTTEIPFAKPISRREIASISPLKNSSVYRKMNKEFSHIPKWLPEIPEVENEKDGDTFAGNGLDGFRNILPSPFGVMEKMEVEMGGERRDLPEKREMVSFKIGVNKFGVRGGDITALGQLGVRNDGVCRGRKRLFCQTWKNDNSEGVLKANVMSTKRN